MLFFADSGERAVVQGAADGLGGRRDHHAAAAARFLDDPFHDGVGGLQPTAMERTLEIIDEMVDATGTTVTIPCDARGEPDVTASPPADVSSVHAGAAGTGSGAGGRRPVRREAPSGPGDDTGSGPGPLDGRVRTLDLGEASEDGGELALRRQRTA